MERPVKNIERLVKNLKPSWSSLFPEDNEGGAAVVLRWPAIHQKSQTCLRAFTPLRPFRSHLRLVWTILEMAELLCNILFILYTIYYILYILFTSRHSDHLGHTTSAYFCFSIVWNILQMAKLTRFLPNLYLRLAAPDQYIMEWQKHDNFLKRYRTQK